MVMTYVLSICGESMIDACRHDHQIELLKLDPDPVVISAPDIEEAAAVDDVADLLVLVQMLVEERLHLLLVHGAHGGGRDGDLISILVVARCGEGIHVGQMWVVEVVDAKLGEVFRGDFAAGVMVLALVALRRYQYCQISTAGLRGRTGRLSNQYAFMFAVVV
jgi:hypothetical protein